MDIVKFDRWVRCVIRNYSYSYFRRQNRYYSKNVSLLDESWEDKYFIRQVSIDDYEVEVSDGILYSSICKLTEKRKAIIMLHYFVGFTDEETGSILDIPRTTVHYNRKQSLKELRKELESAKSGNN